jgi:hypothetical protein
MSNIGTYWRSTDLRYKYSIFAVVQEYGTRLTAWELEMRGNNIFHPAYGTISLSNIHEIDVFTTSHKSKIPSFVLI